MSPTLAGDLNNPVELEGFHILSKLQTSLLLSPFMDHTIVLFFFFFFSELALINKCHPNNVDRSSALWEGLSHTQTISSTR